MPDLEAVWRAGRVRRWHMSAELSWTDDFADGHAGRVARLLMQLKPDCRVELLRAALAHDDGEHVAGDISRPAKDAMDEDAARALEDLEARARGRLWGRDPFAILSFEEVALLRLCDLLDGWMWARAHLPPHVLGYAAWQADRGRLALLADRLRLSDAVASIIGDAVEAEREGRACPGLTGAP